MVDPSFQMWVTFGVILFALILYALEWLALEVTSLLVIVILLVFFHFFPVTGAEGRLALGPERILSGFANPALITVAALLVVGQALVLTGGLETAAGYLVRTPARYATFLLIGVLALTAVLSAFLNNTPVVVILIPILQVFAQRLERSPSRVMIPLSYAAILGGMTTLIGSSTNLLVSGVLEDIGQRSLSMFEFVVPSTALAAIGLIYVFFVAPRLLPDRSSPATFLADGSGKQFIAQITIGRDSKLVGQTAVGGFFPGFGDMTVRLVQRRERAFLPPFDNLTLRPSDVVVIAATRGALTEALKRDPSLNTEEVDLTGEPERASERRGQPRQMLAEVMIAPASRMIGLDLQQIGFRYRYNCIVLGIQRRSRMIRATMSEIRLEAGDVLLIQGGQEDIQALRGNSDMVLMEWSAADMPTAHHARRAVAVFVVMVGLAASGLVPILVAALGGACAMILLGCLNIRQAGRAIDRRIVLLIAASLAMGASLQETGGAAFVAHAVTAALGSAGEAVIMSGFFLVVAIATNLLSNNACAVLFTPIGVSLAQELGMDVHAAAIAVLFAANCSFASPVGYQTNLLVMGPGHYKFLDFVRAGLPLLILMWIAYSFIGPLYFGY